mmetsp:Transcript_10576/g.23817  ORF Transcript_10576/g.23817 Transcript_10576/m.23817 type:complete len:504 (-) Transcript_10576:106-1617(-)
MASLRNVYLAFVFIAFGGLLFGYMIGITSNVITKGQLLCSSTWTGAVGTWTSVGFNQCYELSSLAQGFLSSVNLVGACLSSLFCFRYADNMGRKLEVQIGAALYFLGSVLTAASPTLWGVTLGFTVYGLGIGFAMHAAPVYIAEMSPAEVRGMLVSAKEAVIVLGIFLGFFFGFICSKVDTFGWRLALVVSAVLALVMEVGITYIPQSPRFLVLVAARSGGVLNLSSRLMQDARQALCFYRQASAAEVEEEFDLMYRDAVESVGTSTAKWTDSFKYPLPLVIGCGLVLLQQVTGQPTVLYFATNIFKTAGFGAVASLSSVFIGLVKLLATLFTVWRVDQYGRRFLLFVGISMMAVSLLTLAVAFLFRRCDQPGVSVQDCPVDAISQPLFWSVATVVALMLYVSGYQVGFGPIAWLMISEVFPLSVRGAAFSIAAVVNFTFNILTTLTNEVMSTTLTPSGVFFLYLFFSLCSIVFVYCIVPETKGKTLEEIEAMLTTRSRREMT